MNVIYEFMKKKAILRATWIRHKLFIYCTDKLIENRNILSYLIKVITRAPYISLPAYWPTWNAGRLLNWLGFLGFWKIRWNLSLIHVISIFTMLTISHSPITKYNTKRKRVSRNMGLTFQITSKCKDHFATLTYKNAKNRYYCPE